jgi:hypothetical protein
MWTIAEIASKIMKYSSPIERNTDYTQEDVQLPEKYFDSKIDFVNDKTYLCSEFSENSFHSNFASNVSYF